MPNPGEFWETLGICLKLLNRDFLKNPVTTYVAISVSEKIVISLNKPGSRIYPQFRIKLKAIKK